MESRVGLVLDLVVLDPSSLVEDHVNHGVGASHAAGDSGVGLDDARPAAGAGQDHRTRAGYEGVPWTSERNTNSMGVSTSVSAAIWMNAPSSARAVFSAVKAWSY